MVNYQCPRCHYNSNLKIDIKRHYDRKKTCKTVYEDISIEKCLETLNKPKIKEHICEYCDKNFTRKHDLKRHKEKCEKISHKKEIEDLKIVHENALKNLEEKLTISVKPPSNYNYIYLLQTREFINSGEPIYKLGKTRNPKTRLSSYPKGSQVHLLLKCFDCDLAENDLLETFESKFVRMTEFGSEYFSGDLDMMVDEIIKYF